MWLASRRASEPHIRPPAHTDDEIRRYFADVLVPHRETWVAVDRDGERITAVMVLHDGWVDQLYVHPGHTGRAIGSRLLDQAKDAYAATGLQLWTFQANAGARRFYERHGFEAVELTDGVTNEERAPDVRYVWPRREG